MLRPITLALLFGALCLAPSGARADHLPPVRHVFVVVLENKGYDETFGPGSQAPYLSRTLAQQGQLLTDYYGIGHQSLGNYIAMVSGQPPNLATQSDCQIYQDFAGGIMDADGVAVGQGCVYPRAVTTVADQLQAKGMTWKGYMEDMGTPCRHPALNAPDPTQQARVGDQYAARHNPFVYFHSIIDRPSCAANDVPLDRLPADLADAASTANFSFITPNLCNDGHDAPCVDGSPGGLTSADAWLREWIPKITSSPAYQADGLLIVTFDEAEGSGASADATACCHEKPGPNTPNPGGLVLGPGGGRIGAVVLSPWTTPGSVNAKPYNHYALLRTVEDAFGLPHLGYAAQSGLEPFGNDVFGSPAATPPAG
jgi:phospholipase C